MVAPPPMDPQGGPLRLAGEAAGSGGAGDPRRSAPPPVPALESSSALARAEELARTFTEIGNKLAEEVAKLRVRRRQARLAASVTAAAVARLAHSPPAAGAARCLGQRPRANLHTAKVRLADLSPDLRVDPQPKRPHCAPGKQPGQ